VTTTPPDKTGASTTVSREAGRFTIAVDDRQVGFAEFTDAGGRRTFPHTVVDEAFQGRGLATILVAAALQATRADGLRIVAPCSMVADYLDKSGEYDDLVDPV
jgi:predicted GNAT family acetyltransferase